MNDLPEMKSCWHQAKLPITHSRNGQLKLPILNNCYYYCLIWESNPKHSSILNKSVYLLVTNCIVFFNLALSFYPIFGLKKTTLKLHYSILARRFSMLIVYYIVPLQLPFAMAPKVYTGSPYRLIKNKILKFCSFLLHLAI